LAKNIKIILAVSNFKPDNLINWNKLIASVSRQEVQILAATNLSLVAKKAG
jgi:hypothetical protein